MKKFKLKGDVVYQKYEGKIYRKLNPRYIELVSDETQEESILNLELYYTENAVDDQLFEDSQRYLVNTYISQYNWETKEEEYFEEPVIIDVSKATNELQQKAFNIIKNRFVINDEKVYRLGVKAVLLNGKEKRQITMEDLTEEERDLIECGLATLDEISAEYGNSINGESVNELKVIGFAYGYNKGNQETEIEVSKLLGVNTQDVLQDELFEEELNLDFNLPFA